LRRKKRKVQVERMKGAGNKKGLHVVPLVLGLYGGFLGLGLVARGLLELREGMIGALRLVFGLGLTGFGLYGLWDGVRDLVRGEKQTEEAPARQFILNDLAGNRHSSITSDLLGEQLDRLMEGTEGRSFSLQALPPLPVEGYGALDRVLCLTQEGPLFAAFLKGAEGETRLFQKGMAPDSALKWLEELLAGRPDLGGWEEYQVACLQEEEEESAPEELPQGVEAFFPDRLERRQEGQFLILCGESWRNELKFFSARDVELAVEGVHGGKYQWAVLQWGSQLFDILPGAQDELVVVWNTNITGSGEARFFVRGGTAVQIKFLLVHYMDRGSFESMSGWVDITAQIEEKRKDGKRHG